GLHPKDTAGLVSVLKELRNLGNTVLVIEHDVDVMEQADWIIDIGPGAGMKGGEIVGQGTLESLKAQEQSVTGNFLKEDYVPRLERRADNGQKITVYEAVKNNLKNVTVSYPHRCFMAVTGVSGSG